MDDYESLSHSKWECKYHVVFIPKYRRKTLYGELRQHLGEVFRKLAMQKESRVEEGHLMPDHVHMMKIRGLAGDRLYQRQERHPFGPCLWREEAQFHGPALLGEGIFCLDGRSRRNCDTGIHQEAGGRGQPPRSTEHVALKATFRWPTEPGSRQRPQRAALSGPKPKDPM